MRKSSKTLKTPTSPTAGEILAELVSFSCTSGGDNSQIIHFIGDYLKSLGIKPHILEGESSPAGEGSPTGGRRYNIFASVGPEKDGGVLLSGHTDVVPASSQEWHGDPFQLREAGERFYGRGTTDMKGFLACVLSLVPRWLSQKRNEPIHIACTYDEETGCIGVKDLIPLIGSTLPRPDAVIVGEPTELTPVFGHKGAAACRTTVKGREAHSSRPDRGVNAIYEAAEIIAELKRIAERTLSREANNPQASLFDPPCTTVSVGTIHGGTARNIVAGECELEWEIRTLPWESADTYIEELEAFCREHFGTSCVAPSVTTQIERSYPGLIPDRNNMAYTYYLRMTGAPEDRPRYNGTETSAGLTTIPTAADSSIAGTSGAETVTSPLLSTAPFGTEAGRYSIAGIPAIVWGPGSIAQAHTKDEYIEKHQLEECRRYLARL
ncbi:MAG: M20/M25/M40 family metallo-hydrolase [Spirochaetia bacterium]